MHIEYHKDYSGYLGRDMEYKVYGHAGKALIAFPTMHGNFWQWEDLGMINALSGLIDDGRIQVFTVDGIDGETVKSGNWDKLASIHRYDQYMNYMQKELLPRVLDTSNRVNNEHDAKAWTTGASMGAMHAANFFFHNPWQVDGIIAMSGAYAMRHFFGDYLPDDIYRWSPLDYLHGSFIDNRWQELQKARIVFVCGQGAYEEPGITDTKLIGEVLAERDIPAWIDLWGYDVEHDWPQWQKQLPYVLEKIL